MQDDLTRFRRTVSARLIIVDDHELARAGLRSMLTGVSGIEIVGEAPNGREGVQLSSYLRPDIVLLDVRMPEMDGLAATRAIKQTLPHTHILIMTLYENPDYLVEAFKAGASGFLLKDATRQELIGAIRQVLSGRSIFSEEVVRRTLNRFTSRNTIPSPKLAEALTPRERDVLRLLAQGRTNREIANLLTVSVGTVKIHVQHIISKLGVTDRTQAAVRAVELGLVAFNT